LASPGLDDLTHYSLLIRYTITVVLFRPPCTSINVSFYATTGSDCTPFSNHSIAAGGRLVVNLSDMACVGSPYIGSVRIVSNNNQRLAVVSTQYSATSFMITENHRATSSSAYAPLIQNGNSGWQAGLVLQNGAGSGATLTTLLRSNTGSGSCSSQNWINNLRSWIIFPLPCSPGSTVAPHSRSRLVTSGW
jgi:hypothetical protein